MASQTRPEPMNASPHHSKVKVSLTLGHSIFVAGEYVTGKMEIECRADRGLGIGTIMVELLGIEELTSRDHSATSTFMHTRRLFQGPGLPPSNAVQPFPSAGEPPLPRDYHQARRGISTFLFRFPIPPSSPSAISFGSGLACVKYEIRASVGVAWKGDKRLVTDKKQIDVVESYEEDFARVEPQGVIIGENGKIWVQGRVVGGFIVGGECACVELQVKNHSSKKNTGLNITLTRMLHLPGVSHSKEQPLQISDTLTTVAFRGPEYIVPPGGEGVASLVFDVPKDARSVKGGTRDGGEDQARATDPLFEVRCVVGIKMLMGIGSRDICLDLPVTIVHPSVMPDLPVQEQYPPPSPQPNLYPYPPLTPNSATPYPAAISPVPFHDQLDIPYALPMSPVQPLVHQGHVWFPPPLTYSPAPAHDPSVPFPNRQYYLPVPEPDLAYHYPPRPSSAGAFEANQHMLFEQQHLLPLDIGAQVPAEPEQGKGERASRISQHLHSSSRNRSVSPQSHRFPLPVSHSSPIAAIPLTRHHGLLSPPLDAPTADSTSILIPSSVVHSPRPVLSPKQSFSLDHNTVPKSMRVEELEKMADELKNEDLSSDIPKVSTESGSKTLPPPPVPSTKLQPRFSPPRPRVDLVMEPPEPVEADKTPPTPTLTAIMPSRQPRQDSGLERTESGLDALERRLLAEVGTRKFDLAEIRPQVGTVQPIGIPQPNQEIEPLLDSAISSLSLAEHDSDERTQRLGKSSVSGDDRDFHERGRGQRLPPIPSSRSTTDRDDEPAVKPRRAKKKEWTKDGEAHRFRKLAKGRVAAWLGGIDPDVPPPETPSSLDITPIPDDPDEPKRLTERPMAGDGFPPPPPPRDAAVPEVSSAPNPRSSGFVPIKTLQRTTSVRRSGQEPAPANAHAKKSIASPDRMKQLPVLHPTPVVPQTLTTDLAVSPPSSKGALDNVKIKTPAAELGRASVPVVKESPRLPAFLRQPDMESKYDVKSKRGGRGGKVTAVAAIWANAAAQSTEIDNKRPRISPPTKTRPARSVNPAWPPPKPVASPSSGPATAMRVDPPRNPTRPVIKSLSVPAIISSSHATPTLSTTASLARVAPTLPNQNKYPVKLSPTTLETSSEPTNPPKASGGRPTAGEFAFGQARLRDLIKKYQGQAH